MHIKVSIKSDVSLLNLNSLAQVLSQTFPGGETGTEDENPSSRVLVSTKCVMKLQTILNVSGCSVQDTSKSAAMCPHTAIFIKYCQGAGDTMT